MRTLIVRLFVPVDAGDGRLHGTIERPGRDPVTFCGTRQLVHTITDLAGLTGLLHDPPTAHDDIARDDRSG